jgi:hypothetical protein
MLFCVAGAVLIGLSIYGFYKNKFTASIPLLFLGILNLIIGLLL